MPLAQSSLQVYTHISALSSQEFQDLGLSFPICETELLLENLLLLLWGQNEGGT
jgi:hypothetical protein